MDPRGIIDGLVDGTDDENKLFIRPECRATDEDILHMESCMGSRLPDSYVWFLKRYGAGGLFDSFIDGMGIGDSRYQMILDSKSVADTLGLQDSLYIGCYDEKTVALLSLSKDGSPDGKVVVLDPESGEIVSAFESFYDYVIECFTNMEDD